MDEPDALPELTDEAMRAASEALAARGDETLTRAEAAVLIFGALTADNKAADYPLRFTDLEPGSEAARAAAYLDSYGMFARYDEDNEPISDGDLFRPDEGVTRADFIHRIRIAGARWSCYRRHRTTAW
ncbi:MAG: S-layer homology domain-containing protein [Lachnospiraceae bacterium]